MPAGGRHSMFEWLKSKKRRTSGPNFSSVNSRAKAEQLWQSGELQRTLLLPAEFGGEDIPPNVVYIPAFAVEMKSRIDVKVIKPLIADKKVTRYVASPEYEGDSFVPIAINISATDPGQFSARVAIWGRALADKQADN